MNESQMHYAKEKKPDKSYAVCNSSYMAFLKRESFRDKKN
jgi:hypothetical protein